MSAAHDIIIVGAGVAGLRAAQCLIAAGRDVTVIDAADRVGGRIATDRHGDFLVDRGFQLLNPAYPQLAHCVDMAALDLRVAAAAVRVEKPSGSMVWGNPVSDRRSTRTVLRHLFTGVRAVPQLSQWALRRPGRDDDRSTAVGLRDSSFPDSLRRDIMEPFLRGVLLDEHLDTPYSYTQWVLRTLVRAQPGVPARGMGALPAAMCERLSAATLMLSTPVETVTATSVRTAQGELRATAVIDARSIATAPATHRVSTWWFATPTTSDRTVVLDGVGGRLLNALDLAAVNPNYAPASRGLIAASSLTTHDDDLIRDDVARLYGLTAHEVELVVRHDIEHALPRCTSVPRRASRVIDGIVTAGDATATPSIQGALASGADAARRVLSA